MTIKRFASSFTAVTAAVLLTACDTTGATEDSSFDSSRSNVPEEFVALVESSMEPPTEWGGPVESPAPRPNTLIVGIPCSKAAEGCELTNQGFKEAAEVMGWEYRTLDPAGDNNKQVDAIDQAVNMGADVIALVAIDPERMRAPLERAKAAGVTVVAASTGWEDKAPSVNIAYEVSGDAYQQGLLMGAYLSYLTNCQAKVAMLNDPGFRTVVQRYDGTIENLGKCEGNEITGTQQFNVSEITTNLGQVSQAFFQSQREANIAWIPYDSALNTIVPSTQQAGAADLALVSFDANRGAMKYLEDGSINANVGFPLVWQGWAVVDAANRLLQGEQPPASYGIPSRLLTKDDVAAVKDAGYQGDIDYREKFVELWTTGSTTKDVTVQGR